MRDYFANRASENAGILCVFHAFRSEELREKTHRPPPIYSEFPYILPQLCVKNNRIFPHLRKIPLRQQLTLDAVRAKGGDADRMNGIM